MRLIVCLFPLTEGNFNIICVYLDTLSADVIGLGKKYSYAQTPNFDGFQSASLIVG